MSDEKQTKKETPQAEPVEAEIPQTLEEAPAEEASAPKTAQEILDENEAERIECEKTCIELDGEVSRVNDAIAALRKDKDKLLAEKDEVLKRIQALRPSPALELQRHLRVQREARAERNEKVRAAQAFLGAAVGAPASPLDAKLQNRPRQKPNGAR